MKWLIVLTFSVLLTTYNLRAETFLIHYPDRAPDQTQRLIKSLGTGEVIKLPTTFIQLYKVSIDSQNRNQMNALKKLRYQRSIKSIQPNVSLKIAPEIRKASITRGRKNSRRSEIQDTYFNRQWGFENTGDNSISRKRKFGIPGIDIDAIDAWSTLDENKKITVAIVDTGMDLNHPDLKANLWVNEKEKNGRPGVDDDGNGFIDDIHGYDFVHMSGSPWDDNSHGTHCAGTIGALHNNQGIRGIVPHVSLMPIKFARGDGSASLETALLALDYAIKMKADVISNSWGFEVDPPESLIHLAQVALKKNIVMVFAAGNSDQNIDHAPSTAKIPSDNVIVVGAHNSIEDKWPRSNYGKKSVHLMAPGVDIFSTIPNNQYASYTGSSMAAPFVSGIAALLKWTEPHLTPVEIKERLIRTSAKSLKLDRYSESGGRVDAYRALNNISN
ncbi:MAG: S8 family serine peptidase [Halobacteriovoraceae bacterium]|nr:S8 family serine peptidase [Halobacteriovoraceae bacterium]MCB9095751.1 S8 family serine peptidase [Halobacteriovoraceae bacterium]